MEDFSKNELNQEELENVTGGGIGDIGTKSYPNIPANFSITRRCCVETSWKPCGGKVELLETYRIKGYDDFVCTECGQGYRHFYEGDKWAYVKAL